MGQPKDRQRCAFCCPLTFDHALSSLSGKGNLTKLLKQWRKMGSPVYEAAFAFGMLGLLLPPDVQRKLRRRVGERPKFNRKWSWAHRKKARLHALRHGKPIPEGPQLRDLKGAALLFWQQCHRPFSRRPGRVWLPWVEELHCHVRLFSKYRMTNASCKQWRRKWWQLRRRLQQCLQPVVADGAPFPAAVEWAAAEGILDVDI